MSLNRQLHSSSFTPLFSAIALTHAPPTLTPSLSLPAGKSRSGSKTRLARDSSERPWRDSTFRDGWMPTPQWNGFSTDGDEEEEEEDGTEEEGGWEVERDWATTQPP